MMTSAAMASASLVGVLLAPCLYAASPASAQAPLVNFEGEKTGDFVEGLGTVHPDLEIDSLFEGGKAKVIETGVPAISPGIPGQGVYGAASRFNNCLEDAEGMRVDVGKDIGTAKGFADHVAQAAGGPQEFEFTFAPGVTVNRFSIKMFDYGDLVDSDVDQEVALTGSSASGQWSSDGFGFRGPLPSHGDACGAEYDTKRQPGHVKLEVTEPAMTRVILEVRAGGDPNVGFDSISFTRDDIEIDIKPNGDPNCFNINGSGVIPVAINGRADFDVIDIDPTTFSLSGLKVRVKNNDTNQCHEEDWNGDGFTDLVCQFEDDPSNWSPGEGSATLTGTFDDGTPFESSDSICLRAQS